MVRVKASEAASSDAVSKVRRASGYARLAVAALVLSSHCWAAIARVQHVMNAASGSGTINVTLAATTIGHLIVVCGSDTAGPTTMTMSDNGSNSYTPVTGSPNANTLACSWTVSTASTTQATMTTNASGALIIEAIEYSGEKSPTPVDQVNFASGTSATWTATITPTAGSPAVYVGFVHTATTGSYSAASGFTALDALSNSFDSASAQDQIVASSSGTITFTGSTPGAASVAWNAVVISFLGTAAAGGGGSIQVTQF